MLTLFGSPKTDPVVELFVDKTKAGYDKFPAPMVDPFGRFRNSIEHRPATPRSRSSSHGHPPAKAQDSVSDRRPTVAAPAKKTNSRCAEKCAEKMEVTGEEIEHQRLDRFHRSLCDLMGILHKLATVTKPGDDSDSAEEEPRESEKEFDPSPAHIERDELKLVLNVLFECSEALGAYFQVLSEEQSNKLEPRKLILDGVAQNIDRLYKENKEGDTTFPSFFDDLSKFDLAKLEEQLITLLCEELHSELSSTRHRSDLFADYRSREHDEYALSNEEAKRECLDNRNQFIRQIFDVCSRTTEFEFTDLNYRPGFIELFQTENSQAEAFARKKRYLERNLRPLFILRSTSKAILSGGLDIEETTTDLDRMTDGSVKSRYALFLRNDIFSRIKAYRQGSPFAREIADRLATYFSRFMSRFCTKLVWNLKENIADKEPVLRSLSDRLDVVTITKQYLKEQKGLKEGSDYDPGPRHISITGQLDPDSEEDIAIVLSNALAIIPSEEDHKFLKSKFPRDVQAKYDDLEKRGTFSTSRLSTISTKKSLYPIEFLQGLLTRLQEPDMILMAEQHIIVTLIGPDPKHPTNVPLGMKWFGLIFQDYDAQIDNAARLLASASSQMRAEKRDNALKRLTDHSVFALLHHAIEKPEQFEKAAKATEKEQEAFLDSLIDTCLTRNLELDAKKIDIFRRAAITSSKPEGTSDYLRLHSIIQDKVKDSQVDHTAQMLVIAISRLNGEQQDQLLSRIRDHSAFGILKHAQNQIQAFQITHRANPGEQISFLKSQQSTFLRNQENQQYSPFQEFQFAATQLIEFFRAQPLTPEAEKELLNTLADTSPFGIIQLAAKRIQQFLKEYVTESSPEHGPSGKSEFQNNLILNIRNHFPFDLLQLAVKQVETVLGNQLITTEKGKLPRSGREEPMQLTEVINVLTSSTDQIQDILRIHRSLETEGDLRCVIPNALFEKFNTFGRERFGNITQISPRGQRAGSSQRGKAQSLQHSRDKVSVPKRSASMGDTPPKTAVPLRPLKAPDANRPVPEISSDSRMPLLSMPSGSIESKDRLTADKPKASET